MVLTIKFSQMTDGGDIANDDKVPGLLNGGNVLFNNPWTFLPPGSTADRPTPDPSMYYRLRFNTDDQLYEYYDAILGQWTQLQESFFTAGPFVIYEASMALPDAFNLGSLTTGILKQSVLAGVATPAIALLDTDYYGPGMVGYMQQPAGVKDVNGNIVCEFKWDAADATEWIQIFNGKNGDPAAIAVDGLAADVQLDFYSKGQGQIAFNSEAITNQYSFFSGPSYQHQTVFFMPVTSATRTVTWQDSDGTVAWLSDVMNTVQSLEGTEFQVLVNGTFGSPQVGNIVLTLPQDIDTTSSPTFAALTLTAPLTGANGGTGVNNGSSTLTLGGSLSTIGAFTSAFTMTGTTNVTFPTSGTLATTSQLPTPAALSKVDDTNVTLTLGGSPSTALLQATSLTLGWTGTLSAARGGTGVNNGASTITIGGSVTLSGAFTFAGTLTGNTAVTFPTSGTLATTASASGIVNSGSINQLAWYAANGTTLSGLSTANNSVLVTNGSGVPSLSTILPSGLSATNMNLTTPTLGVATATSINFGGSALSAYAQSSSYAPTITFDTPGDLSVVYSNQVGTYTRIGNIVTVNITLSATPTYTTASGLLRISLPITPSANAIGSVQYQASAWPVGTTSIMMQVVNGNSGAVIGVNGSAVATNYISTTQALSGQAINTNISVTYLV